MVLKIILMVVLAKFANCQRPAIDSDFIQSVLDSEECDRQLQFIQRNVLLGMQFADAGIRIPRGVFVGGIRDLGNYHQCLGIKHSTEDMDIRGKYCAIDVPADQSINPPRFEYPFDSLRLDPSALYVDKEVSTKVNEYESMRARFLALSGDFDPLERNHTRTSGPNPFSGTVFSLGVCVPRPCSTKQAISTLFFNVTETGFRYWELYCRLPGDKPRGPAEIVAIVIFSVLGFVTTLSTGYDVYHRFVQKTDLKKINPNYQSFSVYTNGKRLMTFSSGPGNLKCVDGIRTLAMLWVIVGHSYSSEPFVANPLDSFQWMVSPNALWITAATATVDTFFTLSGLLLVYTTAGKMTGNKLLRNLHWFYLTRIVRIMPLLAATVLLEASFFNHLSDGPYWQVVARRTDFCRTNWWSTLLNIQNLLNPRTMCAGHSWYVAIDMQLYVVSPLILYWVFTGSKLKAWIALLTSLVSALIASTIYVFYLNLEGGVVTPGRPDTDYMPLYYLHTLPRASVFFVGMIFGYVLHLCREKKIRLSWVVASLFWLWSFATLGAIIYYKYSIKSFDWNNQFVDNFMNSFMRPSWAYVISWIIFACVHGYGGPINWFLSLDVWKFPARLTYGMYLIHYPFMFAINGTAVTPIFFSVGGYAFKFLSHLVICVVASYILTLFVESPITALYRELMKKVQKKATQ